jgi:proton glutamate symport protein
VILGVDALMDMARTSLNVLGNCLATVVMARSEGSFALSADEAPVVGPHSGSALRIPTVMAQIDVG